MLKRICWVKVGVWLLIASILLTLQHCLYPWPKRLPNVRLEPSRPILRDADVTPDNAFFYLRQLIDVPRANNYDWGNEYDRFCDLGMQGGPYPALETRLTEIAGNLELCRQAAALPKCQVVPGESSYDSLVTHLGTVREVVRNLQFRAERAAAQGDWTAAGDDCRIALRIGDDLSRGGGLNNRLANYACCSMACNSLRRVTLESQPPAEFLRGMIQFFDELDRNTEPFAETMRYARLFGRSVVRMVDNRLSRALHPGDPGRPPARATTIDALACFVLPLAGSTPRRTAAHLDAIYSYVVDIAAEPRLSGRTVVDEALGFVAKGRDPIRFVFDDPVGRLLAKTFLPILDSVADKHRAYVATMRGTELVLAVRLYQRTHDGKLPARIADLVPDCLAAVPVDPFSRDGEAFLYRVDADGKWTVYSRGPNLRDDGAVWNYLDYKVRDEHPDSLDVIFSASEPAQRRDDWRREHPDESVDR